MGNGDSKTVWVDKSGTGGIRNTHARQGLGGGGGSTIYRIHDREIRKNGKNLWIESILQDILNNVLEKKIRTPTVFHKAPLSAHPLLLLRFYNKAEMDGL